jgi:predicted transcriptional regulator
MRATANLATRTDTSDAAYAAAPSGAAARVLEAIRNKPRTVDELMRDLHMSHSTCSASANKLMRDGWIVDNGIRSVTRTGRTAIVWEAAVTPRPLRRIAPTRRQLIDRINSAIYALDRCLDRATIRDILRGEADV